MGKQKKSTKNYKRDKTLQSTKIRKKKNLQTKKREDQIKNDRLLKEDIQLDDENQEYLEKSKSNPKKKMIRFYSYNN
jgi:hypothetical protein